MSLGEKNRLLADSGAGWHTAGEAWDGAWSPQRGSNPAHPQKSRAEEWSGSAGGGSWRRGRAPCGPDPRPDTPCGLRKTTRVKWLKSFRSGHAASVPAEKGKKASLLTKLPSSSRKWEGLNVFGVSHLLSSWRTEVNRGRTVVPFWVKSANIKLGWHCFDTAPPAIWCNSSRSKAYHNMRGTGQCSLIHRPLPAEPCFFFPPQDGFWSGFLVVFFST